MATYEDFLKLDFRVATVVEAGRIEGSDKLLKLKVNLGEDERQIIAGIGKKYNPEDLVGRQIVIIANLESRSLMGHESQGMLLAADSESGPVILSISEEVLPNAKIK